MKKYRTILFQKSEGVDDLLPAGLDGKAVLKIYLKYLVICWQCEIYVFVGFRDHFSKPV